MKRLLGSLMVVGLLGLGALGAAGCVEEARCEEACVHECDICGVDCDELDITNCTNFCQDTESDPDRVDCVIKAQSCDDLWKC